jgi:ParB/RepB/Spo0J family partition protein
MEIKNIPREKIIPDPDQPRQHFDKESIQELADSIKQFGLLQPLIVKSGKNGTYEIIAGERRWRASKFADMNELPCIVKDVTKQVQEVQGLIENVHRVDLSPIEKGHKTYSIFQLYGIDLPSRQLAKLVSKIRWRKEKNLLLAASREEETIVDVCKLVGKSYNTIASWLNTISISPEIQQAEIKKAETGDSSDGDILSRIATIEDEELQTRTYAKIEEQDMSRGEASRFISKIKDADEDVKEAVLTPGIKPIIDMDDRSKPMFVDIPEEDARSLKQAIEDERKEREEKLRQPEVREQARLMNSWIAHSHMNLDHLTCPVCGAGHAKLVWSCHKISVDEAKNMLHDKLNKKRGKNHEKI